MARFYDQGAHQAVESVEIRFHCDGLASCDGACTDTDADAENCGACGQACDGCEAGACHRWSECYHEAPYYSCDEICRQQGTTCADVCGGRDMGCYRYGDACEDDFDPSRGYGFTCDEEQINTEVEPVACCCAVDP